MVKMKIKKYKGKDIELLSKEELIECVKYFAEQIEMERGLHNITLDVYSLSCILNKNEEGMKYYDATLALLKAIDGCFYA